MKCKNCGNEIGAKAKVCTICWADQSTEIESEQRVRVRKAGTIKLLSTVLFIFIFGDNLELTWLAVTAALSLAFVFEAATGISTNRRLF